MMKESTIISLLQKAAIEAAQANNLPIKILGRGFKSPQDGVYLEQIYIPNNVLNEFWGPEGKTYRGIYRLVLHAGLNEKGVYPYIDLISAVSEYFAKGTVFQKDNLSVKIYEQPDLTGVIEAPPELLFPVSVRYYCFYKG